MQESPRIAEQLRSDLAPTIPGLEGLEDIKLLTGGDEKYLVFQSAIGGRLFPIAFAMLSEGQRALFILYAILRGISREASFLFFDEPDNFVAEAVASSECCRWSVATCACGSGAKTGAKSWLDAHGFRNALERAIQAWPTPRPEEAAKVPSLDKARKELQFLP